MYWEIGSLFGATMTEFPEPVYSTKRADGLKKRFFAEASHGSKDRSRTFGSIANAMAQQWSNIK